MISDERLARVEMHGPDVDGTVRRFWYYRFDYRNDSITERSLLRRVRQCDANDVCNPATRFEWTWAVSRWNAAARWSPRERGTQSQTWTATASTNSSWARSTRSVLTRGRWEATRTTRAGNGVDRISEAVA
jgi:hypothetical protein